MKRPFRAEKAVRASRNRGGFWTRTSSESGMVTAELALTFPAVILILVSLALTGSAGMAQVQVSASARAACRAVAIGEETSSAVASGERLLGGGGQVSVSSTGKDVSCTARRELPAMLGLLGMVAHSEAVIPREDSW